MFHQMNGSNDDVVDIEFEINNESNHDPPSPEAHARSPETHTRSPEASSIFYVISLFHSF
jgi:hypothetical protein